MNEIIAVNRKLRAVVGDKYREDNVLWLTRDELPMVAAEVPSSLQSDFEALRAELSKLVPEDFEYTVELGDEEPSLGLSYSNGLMTEACWWEPLKRWLSLADQLGKINWAELRTKAVAQSEIFDELQEAAKEAPENIPPTKRLQKKFGEQMDAFVKAAQTDRTKVQVLLVSSDWGVLELKHLNFESLKSFRGDLRNLMTCGHHVIGVVAEGRVVSAAKIDRMKREALEDLKGMPISYAQASGRMFPPIVLDD